MRKNAIVFFNLKKNKKRLNRRKMRRIVSQPNIKSIKSKSRIKSSKSESNLMLLKQKKKYRTNNKIYKSKSKCNSKSIQDFEFAYQIKHSTNMSSVVNSFLLFSLFIYTIECENEKKQRITFILTCLIIFQMLNR